MVQQMVQQSLAASGLGMGPSAQRLIANYGDLGALRPYAGADGRAYVTVQARDPYGTPVWQDKDRGFVVNARPDIADLLGSEPRLVPYLQEYVTNAPALLRREDWLMIDRAVIFAAKQRLRLWNEIYGRNPYNIPNGFAVTAIQHGIATGDNDAIISMDPVRKSQRARPILDTVIIPLPTIHSDGNFTAREIAVSRNSGMPLDTTPISLSARKVAEVVEALCVGTTTYAYAGGNIQGITNFTQRASGAVTAPTGSNGGTTISELVGMMKALQDKFYYGPYIVFYSNNWNNYLDLDYNTTYPTGETVRARILRIDGISGLMNLDYLPTTKYKLVMVQMTEDVIQGVQGMPFTTVQWEEQGGYEQCFKVVTISLPRLRYDYNGNTGVYDGTSP
jgi:uncharacterized linocin/CFP29 family protein